MPLNPNHNLFSVAPIGPNIMIGRAAALKGGMERDKAMNLLGWLVIATGATPAEIREVIKAAHVPTPVVVPTAVVAPRVVSAPPIVRPIPGPGTQPTYPMPKPAMVVATPAAPSPNAIGSPPTAGNGAANIVPFVGDVDAEEASALAEALKAAGDALPDATKTEPVDTDKLQAAWDAAG